MERIKSNIDWYTHFSGFFLFYFIFYNSVSIYGEYSLIDATKMYKNNKEKQNFRNSLNNIYDGVVSHKINQFLKTENEFPFCDNEIDGNNATSNTHASIFVNVY